MQHHKNLYCNTGCVTVCTQVSAQRLREEARKKEIQENRRKVIEVEKERAHKAADRQYPIPPTEPLIMVC